MEVTENSVEKLKSFCVADEVRPCEWMKPNQSSTQQMKDNLEILSHACQCHDSHCKLAACEKMKIHVNHSRICEYQTNGNCQFCRTLFVLCSYHAKDCRQANCSVINCMRIKAKMKQRRWEHLIFFNRSVYSTIQLIRVIYSVETFTSILQYFVSREATISLIVFIFSISTFM